MTKSEAYFYRLAMPRPFAKGDGAALTAIESAAGNDVNYQDGFPSAYSAPHSGGGKYITRGEMNAIGNLASQNQFYFLAGGINTFDSTFATSIGGYPEGAVLKYLNNGYLYDVISLIDNNTHNFIEEGVDGVNWMYLSVPEKQVLSDIFFEGGTGLSVGSAILGIVRAKKSSALIVETSVSPIIGGATSSASYSTNNAVYASSGCGIMIKDMGDDPTSPLSVPSVSSEGPNWNGWESLSGGFTLIYATNNSYHAQVQDFAGFFSSLTKDNYYAIALMCSIGNSETDPLNHYVIWHLYTSISGTVRLAYA